MKHLKLILLAFLLVFAGTANAQSTKDQFRAILEDFCQSYYDDGFSPKQYIEGSLTVKTVEADEYSDVIRVKGKHSYRGQYIPLFGRKTHTNVDFKAEVTEVRNGLKIKFWKWFEPDATDPHGHWEGPIEKVYIP